MCARVCARAISPCPHAKARAALSKAVKEYVHLFLDVAVVDRVADARLDGLGQIPIITLQCEQRPWRDAGPVAASRRTKHGVERATCK